MSHNFKAKRSAGTYLPKRAHHAHGVTIKQELDLRRMAGLIPNEQALQSVLMQTKPEMRVGGLARLRPYLRFKLSPEFLLAQPVEQA